ncbi:MAG: CBS domain-containing protein [Trueperaceae bacterium]
MRLIVTHERPDFDALAGLALAARLHPGSRIALGDGLPPEVRDCLRLYRDRLDPLDAQTAAAGPVEELIVVDTADRTRLGPFAKVAARVPVVVYDHHPPVAAHDALPVGRGLVDAVGASVTLLVRELRRQRSDLSADLASLALLGLHQDTGGFAFDLTRAEDHEAAAWLLGRGGGLSLVRRFARHALGPEHHEFRTRMLQEVRHESVRGRSVAVAAFAWPRWLGDVAGLAGELLDLEGTDAALLAVRMEERTILIARADGGRIDVGAALRDAAGGGGHAGAGFARSDLPLDDAVTAVLAAFERHAVRPRTARDLMSRPVRTVAPEATVHDAAKLLLQHGHNGLPVVEDQRVVGVLSRRDLDRALQLGLGRSEVRGFMGAPAVVATPGASLDRLEALVARHGVGRLPVVDGEDRLIGIVTRSDLLAARHGTDVSDPAPTERIVRRMRAQADGVLTSLEAHLPQGSSLYLVGGTVRDALLGGPLADLDLAIEGADVHELADALARDLSGRASGHAAFGTATVALPGGLAVDLAGTREERYAGPGALPDVVPSDLRRDLARRDFTVNALALRWTPGPPQLLDPFAGLADLEARLLRVLHPLSFAEDATRIVRGVRLAARLGFTFEDATERQARSALDDGHVARVSPERLRHELDLALRETWPSRALALLDDLGVLERAYGLAHPAEVLRELDRLADAGREVSSDAYYTAMLTPLDADARRRATRRFHLPDRHAAAAARVRRLLDGAEPLDDLLEALGRPGRAVLEAHGDPHRQAVRSFESLAGRRRLRGRDLLELGLAPGPRVGRILDQVARARRERHVRDFDDELALARTLIHGASATKERNDDPT